MEFVVRKITRGKWDPQRGLAPDEVGADAVTSDLRAPGNELSVWECDPGDAELAEVVLALASTLERMSRLDLVLLERAGLEGGGLTLRATPERGTANVPQLNQRHVDIVGLDVARLGFLALQIRDRVRAGSGWRRFREREVLDILCAAIRFRRLDADRLQPSLREAVTRHCIA